MTVGAESKLQVFFKTKFHPVTVIIEPLVLHLKLRVCSPFLEALQPSRLSQKSLLNLPHFAAFSTDLEGVDIKHWKGVHTKGKGTFNKVVVFVFNSGLLTNPI
ncbi:hypothetical protein TSMEX_006940 [Taenia solium]|eukprot:TsM_001086500 transcript=TsM_001086500 gene=TsM_001086500